MLARLKNLFRKNRIPDFGKGKVVWIEGNLYTIRWHTFKDGRLTVDLEKSQ